MVCQEKKVGVKITWPGHLDSHPRLLLLKLYEIQLCVQEMLSYFQIKLFPNITTLFYQEHLHKKFSYVSKKAQIFLIKLFPNITTLFYREHLHVPLYVRNRGLG